MLKRGPVVVAYVELPTELDEFTVEHIHELKVLSTHSFHFLDVFIRLCVYVCLFCFWLQESNSFYLGNWWRRGWRMEGGDTSRNVYQGLTK